MKRRWFRYSLRALLVLVTLSAVAIGWYTHRQKVLRAEKAKLIGKWEFGGHAVHDIIMLSETDFDVGMPHDGIGSIDFHMPDGGDSLGIYRIRGNTLEIAQGKVGEPRPESFDRDKYHNVFTATRVDSKAAGTKP
jgi:hypothetical protein